MGQEVIADQETQEHKIVDEFLQVPSERNVQCFEFEGKIFTNHRNFDKLKFGGLCQSCVVFCVPSSTLFHGMTLLTTFMALFVIRPHNALSEDEKVGLMSGQTKHN